MCIYIYIYTHTVAMIAGDPRQEDLQTVRGIVTIVVDCVFFFVILNKTIQTETQIIYNVDKTKTYDIKHNRYTDEHYYNKTQHINNNITNNISKQTLYL